MSVNYPLIQDPDLGQGQGQPESTEFPRYFNSNQSRQIAPGLPAASVIGMAQSVGAVLPEEVAEGLGQLAIGRLRLATQIAIQFAHQDSAEGLRISDFHKAEEILKSPSYGNRSAFPDPQFKVVPEAGVCVLEEGPEIDLLASSFPPRPLDFRIRMDIDPEFHLQELQLHPSSSLSNGAAAFNGENASANVNGNGSLPFTWDSLDSEWVEYGRVFADVFLQKEGDVESNRTDFLAIVKDIRENSAPFSVISVMCDFFLEYLHSSFGQVKEIGCSRIVRVLHAFVEGFKCVPAADLLRKFSSVLIEVLVHPPGYKIQPLLVNVIIKIVPVFDELLSWTCNYVSEVLKRTLDISQGGILMNEEYQCLLYGALLLANGLEDLGLKHAHEFGWDNSINVLRQRHQGFNGQVSGFPSCLQAELYRFQQINGFS